MSMVEKILVALCLVFSMVSAGVFVYTQMIYKKPVTSNEKEFEKMKEEVAAPEKTVEPYKLKRMMINLTEPTGKERIRFLSIEAAIIPFTEEGTQILDDNQAIVMDAFHNIASRMEIDELNSISGKILLENRLKTTINDELGEKVIRSILFQHFIIQ